jgi:MFS family permease
LVKKTQYWRGMALANSDTTHSTHSGLYYGWWIVLAAFLNLFFVVGIVFYGFPVFYPYFVEALGFTRAQVTQGFFLGFLFAGLPFGLLAGSLIDRVGARPVILGGVAMAGGSLVLMGFITRFWEFEVLCITEVVGYVFAGPIANQVLIARWFNRRRGRAMGYAYLGLGFGGVVASMLVNYLAINLGWRHALELTGALILVVLLPVGILITRSSPEAYGVSPEMFGEARESGAGNSGLISGSVSATQALRSGPFWLILAGSGLAIGTIGAVIQHLILFLKDSGYTATVASRYSAILLTASLAGRVVVGYVADRLPKSYVMAFFYFVIGVSVFLLSNPGSSTILLLFVVVFGFAMGADYMLIPLVASEWFGTASLGKILALIIMGYSIGQWGEPWLVGKLFDARHNYDLAWKMVAVSGMAGAAIILALPLCFRRSR